VHDHLQARSSLAPWVPETVWASAAMAGICKTRDGSMLIHRAGGQDAGEVIGARVSTSGRAVASPGRGAELPVCMAIASALMRPSAVGCRRGKGLEDPLTSPRLLDANLRRGPRGAGPAPARACGVRRAAANRLDAPVPGGRSSALIPMARGMDRVSIGKPKAATRVSRADRRGSCPYGDGRSRRGPAHVPRRERAIESPRSI
jgi:hypothetical protein